MSDNILSPQEQAFVDAAQRCADQINLHAIAGNTGKWSAIRLSDGGSDGVPYDFRREAVAHQIHESQCLYAKVPPDGMSLMEAMSYMRFNRALYDAGFRMTDPDQPHIVMPASLEQALSREQYTAHRRLVAKVRMKEITRG